MSVTSGFFNSSNGDRKYNAEQISAIFDGIINDGVFANIGTAFSVTANSGNNITVGIGRAWFNSIWILNDAILSIAADESEVLLDRYDAVVIEIDRSNSVRAGSIKIVKGTAASTAQYPTMTSTLDVHQYPLAYIYRKAGSSAIAQSDITNMVGTSNCPYVTGILQVLDNDNIVAQWQDQFDTWLESLSDVLNEDTAGNLAQRLLKLENMEIGGRNLLLNTKDMSGYGKSSGVTVNTDNEGIAVGTFASTDAMSWRSIVTMPPIQFSEVRGKTVTFSFLVRSDDYASINNESSQGIAVAFGLCTANSTERTLYKHITSFTTDLSDGWKKVSFTKTLTDDFFDSGSGSIDGTTRLYMEVYGRTVYSMQVKKFKMELGDVATDWSPAPEDLIGRTIRSGTSAPDNSVGVDGDIYIKIIG